MHRAIVSGEITDKTLDHFSRETVALKKSMNIKEVARMLTIHRRDEFAAIKFRRGQNRHGQFRGEKFPRRVTKLPCVHRQNRSTKNMIHLHLHQIAPAPNEQFYFFAILGCGNFTFEACLGESFPHGLQRE